MYIFIGGRKCLLPVNAMNPKALIQSHWIGFPFLVPLLVMLWLHHVLGLSDALNVPTPLGEREAHLYNWIMVVIGYLGVGFFLLHAISLVNRGWSLLLAKLLFLAVYWTAVMLVA